MAEKKDNSSYDYLMKRESLEGLELTPTYLKLSQILLLRHEEFLDLINKLNKKMKSFTEDEPDYIEFSIEPQTDSTMFWKLFVSINCSRISRTGEILSNITVLSLNQFLTVHQSLTQQMLALENHTTSTIINTKVTTQQYNRSISIGKLSLPVFDGDICCICMDNQSTVVLSCTHKFCEECLDRWKKAKSTMEHQTCPICRQDINSKDHFILMDVPDLDNNLVLFPRIRIVLGNESCDLDSTISACIYAYFLHHTCSSKNEILHIPILNTNAMTFRLRSEIRWFLQENNSNMIFIDDINLNELYYKKKLEIILVDHHCLISKLNDLVIEIIDHHQTRRDSIKLDDLSKVNIEHVGSCCTLIAEKLLNSKANFQMTNEIAYLLTGPILFDTLNFSTSAGKTTEKDRQIYKQLLTYRTSTIDDTNLYYSLRERAADTTGMSVQDLLQKDLKQVVGPNIRLLISSLPSEYTVEKFIGQLKTMNEIDEFLSKNDNADGVIILSLESNNADAKRQLGFYVKKFENMPPINEYIQREEHNLSLRERSIPINQARIKLFEQQNIQASRKEILPLIEQFVTDFIPQNSS